MSYPADQLRSRELAAYYYNHSKKQDDVSLEDAIGSYKRKTWGKSLTHGDWYRKEMSPPHSNISDGYFVRYETLYRWRNRTPLDKSRGMVANMIHWLADAVSKNGNIELTIHIGPKSLYQFEQRTLQQIGLWLQVNGEAIYDTRLWRDGIPESRTVEGIDVRYTVKGDSLYAILLDWPQGKSTFPNLQAAESSTIQMLGVQRDLNWRQTGDSLVISRPDGSGHSGFETEISCDHAYAIKITPRPTWDRQ